MFWFVVCVEDWIVDFLCLGCDVVLVDGIYLCDFVEECCVFVCLGGVVFVYVLCGRGYFI